MVLPAIIQRTALIVCRRQPPSLARCFGSNATTNLQVHVTKERKQSRPIVHNNGNDNATSLVDNLLVRTNELMSGGFHHVIAFSGGVDSSLVAALLKLVQSQNQPQQHKVQAVLGVSSAVPIEQIQLAQEVASHLHLDLVKVNTTEGSDKVYLANEGQACLACKTHLYSALQSVVEHTPHDAYLYNGTNADDTRDTTRLGLIAADRFQVKSPLALVSKQEVRHAAKWLGLPNHNVAAAPCLRSRLALGVQATRKHLEMIEKAERRVRQLVDFSKTCNLRVRMLARGLAMVEVDSHNVEATRDRLEDLTEYFVSLGFASVGVRQFKSGSVARGTPVNMTPVSEIEMPMAATG